MKVFIAGPYGDGGSPETIAVNVARADQAARNLAARGHLPYCPHTMTQGWERDPRITREQILELHRSILNLWAEAIYRVPGTSPGADAEMMLARKRGLVEFTWDSSSSPAVPRLAGTITAL